MPCRLRRAHDAVQQRHAQAKWSATRQRFHEATCRGPVEEEFVAHAYIVCRDDERLTVSDELNVADEGFIENGVHQLAIIAAALGLAADFCSFRRSKVAHSRRLAGAGCLRQVLMWISP